MKIFSGLVDWVNAEGVEDYPPSKEVDSIFSMSQMGGSTFGKVMTIGLGFATAFSAVCIGGPDNASVAMAVLTLALASETVACAKSVGMFPDEEEEEPEADRSRGKMLQLYSGDVEKVFAKTVNSGKEAQVFHLQAEGQERPITLWAPTFKA